MNDFPGAALSPETDAQSIAIVGGGISGLATAYELARRGQTFTLFEQSGRLGGIVETFRTQGFVIECGPDSWVAEKPWAREMAIELGLEDQILYSNDERRRTFLVVEEQSGPRLVPMPHEMRMMVPERWAPILSSPLFSWSARLAYLREPGRARMLKASAPQDDESVAKFVRRHFGEEVMRTLARPLLSGVFGGDIEALSVRATMPAFVRMEAEHGSLVTALRRRKRSSPKPQPLFSTLATGLQTLIDGMVQRLPPDSLHTHRPVSGMSFDGQVWHLFTPDGERRFQSVVLATPAHQTSGLLAPLGDNGRRLAGLLPREASSAIIVAFAFHASQAASIRIPRGFGFLVPAAASGPDGSNADRGHPLLACTFVDQKFSHRAPPGAILLRAFLGGRPAESLLGESDEALVHLAHRELARILGPMPEPAESLVRRLPRSLPQYAVGHLERIAELESLAKNWPGLHLAGNSYHGVGLPDLIREGRATAQALLARR